MCKLPADNPIQGLGANVQGSSDVLVVQVKGGWGGVGAGGVQMYRWVERRQTSQLLKQSQRKTRYVSIRQVIEL